MRPRLALLLPVIFVALSVAACGGGAAAAPESLPLTARVIGSGEFTGFTQGQQLSFSTPKAWAEEDRSLPPAVSKAEIRRLTSEGFKKDLTQFLNDAHGNQNGLSAVMQLRSAASAQAELAAQLHNAETHTQIAERFPVKTIPGAVGYGYSGSTGGGENILFADGPFLYLVGYGWQGTAHNPKHAAFIDAATKLYTRVHGHPAS